MVLDQLCRFIPKGFISCFAVVDPSLQVTISPDLSWIPTEYAIKPQEAGGRILPNTWGSFSSLGIESYNSLLKINVIANRAVGFARKFGAEAVWCVLEGQTMIRLARRVAESLGVPLLTQVWDPPYWWLRENKVDKLTTNLLLKKFSNALQASTCCAAASWAMADRYRNDYGTKSIPVIPSLDMGIAMPPASEIHKSKDFIIGLAGQIYSVDEWEALISALDSVQWRIANRDVTIRLLGRNPHLNARGKMKVEFLGWRPQSDTIQLMSEADLLYCPYWFDPLFENEARLSFPAKLTTYLASGRPVLFHGPSYSSPYKFLTDNSAGICCNSLKKEDILTSILGLVNDPCLYESVAANGSLAFRKFLTIDTMKTNFLKFLECAA